MRTIKTIATVVLAATIAVPVLGAVVYYLYTTIPFLWVFLRNMVGW